MKYEELIEKYFSGVLTQGEQQMFDSLYQKDIEFRKEVDFLKDVKKVSENTDTITFRNTLKGFENETAYNRNGLIKTYWKPISAIAAILIIALSISFLIDSKVDHLYLFESYFEPSKNVTSPIVRNNNDDDLKNEAFFVYNKGNYEKASGLFSKLFQETNNSEFLFYQGNSLLAQGNSQQAIEVFNEHLKHNDQLSNRTYWYLALAYLNTNELKLAKKELEAYIASGDVYKSEEAKSLLEDIK